MVFAITGMVFGFPSECCSASPESPRNYPLQLKSAPLTQACRKLTMLQRGGVPFDDERWGGLSSKMGPDDGKSSD
jgi:hypothetical protein